MVDFVLVGHWWKVMEVSFLGSLLSEKNVELSTNRFLALVLKIFVTWETLITNYRQVYIFCYKLTYDIKSLLYTFQ